jgi:UDP-glucose 4-epimerase
VRRILVTGGAGFIGSHLCEHLLANDHEVEALDDLSTGSLDHVAHLRADPRFRCTVGAVEDEDLVARALAGCDAVVHLAAAVGVRKVVDTPVRTIETNVHGAEVVLRLADKARRLVVIASTSEVYGKSAALPFREDADLVLGPTTTARWAYACSKALDEWLALAYWKERRTPVIVVRLFNTVGPRQTGRYGMVIPTFVQQALAGRPITVLGDGTQSRSFTYVGDVVRAIRLLVEHPRAVGEVFNIGSDREITIRALAERVKRLTDSASEIVTIPYDQAFDAGFEDMPRRLPDLTKVRALIGYRPTVGLDEILATVIEEARRHG